MKVKYECASCMQRQAREAIEYSTSDDEKRMNVTMKVVKLLYENYKPNTRSNKLGTDMHRMIKRETNCNDPYKILREKGNAIAEKLVPNIAEKLEKDPTLENYVKSAVAGNIIDFGALEQTADIEQMINDRIKEEPAINDINKLDEALRNAKNVLYLTDNGGEIIFDKLLIKKIKEDYDVNIIIALKEKPILNDALVKDGEDINLDKYATLISTGADSVGVVEEYVSQQLIELMDSSDIIISKGMGNYEGLTEMKNIKTTIFYLLNTKCQVISDEIGVPLGSSVIIKV